MSDPGPSRPHSPSRPSAGADPTAALVALAGLPGIGPATLLRCQEEGAVQAWEAVVAGRARRSPGLAKAIAATRTNRRPLTEAQLAAAARPVDPTAVLARQRTEGRQVLVRGTPGYPARLADDPAAPAVLFVQGREEVLQQPTVAVVGTRNCTRAGRDLAHGLGADLHRAGVTVVSGLALGIDGAAHRGVLAAMAHHRGNVDGEHREGAGAPAPGLAPGPEPGVGPVGVVACGLDIAYPRRHTDLHRAVAGAGLLVSEVPLGLRPTAWRFPARNRIIAGLARAVVVVESRSAGGSMHTVAEALARGVPVLAVPGYPASPAAAGPNDLIYDGATPLRSVHDVLFEIGLAPAAPTGRPGRSVAPPADRSERSVLQALHGGPAALEEVVRRTGLTLEVASRALLALEADGRVACASGWYEAVPAPMAQGRADR